MEKDEAVQNRVKVLQRIVATLCFILHSWFTNNFIDLAELKALSGFDTILGKLA